MTDKQTAEEEAVHRLPGKVLKNAQGRTEQEDYGEWPECTICHEQVDPGQYSLHINAHEA
jgi:hypothetical protein